MGKFGQQWNAFRSWADPLLDYQLADSPIVAKTPATLLEELPVHRRPLVGYRCPRCDGEVVRTHLMERDLACLQCGFEPVLRRPSSYVFEPYTDAAAASRLAMRPDDVRNGAVTVRIERQPLSPFACVGCGRIVDEGTPLKVHRCPDCYLEYCAQLRFRTF